MMTRNRISAGLFATLFLVAAEAQVPQAAPTTANQSPGIQVRLADRIQSELTRQHELLKTLAEINRTLGESPPIGPGVLALLDENLTQEERIRALLHETAPPEDHSGAALLHELLQGAPAIPEENSEAVFDWTLSNGTIVYAQAASEGAPARVAVNTGRSQAVLGIGHAVLLDARKVELMAIKKRADGRFDLKFLFDQKQKSIVY